MRKLTHQDIEKLIPHCGSMCLLETIVSWNECSIHAQATSHTDTTNPLRNSRGLPATAGIEYAAQAMAVHCALHQASEAKPLQGWLVAIRDIRVTQAWLHNILEPLDIVAEHLMSNERALVYRFSIAFAAHEVVSGRITINIH